MIAYALCIVYIKFYVSEGGGRVKTQSTAMTVIFYNISKSVISLQATQKVSFNFNKHHVVYLFYGSFVVLREQFGTFSLLLKTICAERPRKHQVLK